ncbi:MAG TPA: type II toxin-antitoxin system prevent-host-death family antitoxin [Myxococcota bacterium]|nr:type II toxin-antitoxin system prevent-host-death family antitoxin [Myxococcota bacterium]
MATKAVNIAELKNRLSHYLRMVRRGESLLVKDRDQVIARIEPAGRAGDPSDDEEARLADLEARGIIRRGKGKITPEMLKGRPRAKGSVVAALLAEREEGR